MRYPSPLPRLLACVLLVGLPAARAEKLVVVRSTVSGGYEQQRLQDGKRQPQSYVFMTGRYFPGYTHDNSLAKTSFRTIAERLALDLRRQDFLPATALSKADLLLVVHWGVTTETNRDSVALAMGMENLTNLSIESEQAQQALNEAIAVGDLDAAGHARGVLDNLASATHSEQQNLLGNQGGGGEDNAALLGLNAELRKESRNPFGSERQKTLVGMTQEERYFVIVMAYDAQTLINTKRMKRLWTLRASIRSAGVNFHQALDRIGNIAGNYFGTKQDGVAFERTGDRDHKTSVTLGDLIVLGTVER